MSFGAWCGDQLECFGWMRSGVEPGSIPTSVRTLRAQPPSPSGATISRASGPKLLQPRQACSNARELVSVASVTHGGPSISGPAPRAGSRFSDMLPFSMPRLESQFPCPVVVTPLNSLVLRTTQLCGGSVAKSQ